MGLKCGRVGWGALGKRVRTSVHMCRLCARGLNLCVREGRGALDEGARGLNPCVRKCRGVLGEGART